MADPSKRAGGFLYHPIYGKTAFMYQVDISHPVHGALTRFPDEWKDRPWTDAEIAEFKKRELGADQPIEPAIEPAPPRKRGRPFQKKALEINP